MFLLIHWNQVTVVVVSSNPVHVDMSDSPSNCFEISLAVLRAPGPNFDFVIGSRGYCLWICLMFWLTAYFRIGSQKWKFVEKLGMFDLVNAISCQNAHMIYQSHINGVVII